MIVNPLLFHEIVETTRLGLDRQLLSLLTEHYSNDSPLYQDVCRLVNSLNLAEYPLPARTDHEEVPNGNSLDNATNLQHNSEPISTKITPLPIRLPIDTIDKDDDPPGQPSSPKPAEQEPKPTEHHKADAVKEKPPQLSISKRTLSSEPFIGVSTVNVETQVTDVHRGYVPVAKRTLKNRLLKYGDRVGFNRARAPVKKDTTLHVRRASVVEEHLPTYIREQITEIPEPEASNLTGLEPSERGRFHNVLANSNSLYLNEEGATGDSYSEGDNEYILPSSLLRSGRLGLGDSDDDEEDDDGEDDHEDDDEYLFARQS